MKILVMGGGAQGRVIAGDLACSLPQAVVTVADVRDPGLPALPNLRRVEADLSDAGTAAGLIAAHDLAVGALPARLGFRAMRAAIAAARPIVDVSFCAEDALALDAEARQAGVGVFPDCGLAPGISNLVVGREMASRGTPTECTIYVGGVAQNPAQPYGYVVTWALEDLNEEYLRPARIVREGRPTTVPVFSGLERVAVETVGEMEAFYSDGLRTLLDTIPGVREMGEKTLRWPGHAEAVRPLVAAGRLVEELRARCTEAEPRDVVALVIRLRWGKRSLQATLVDYYDPANRLTAMGRTTALTTSAVAQAVAAGVVRGTGVLPLERVAADEAAARFILDRLSARGVHLSWRED